jgi:hypothetical protein
VVDRQVLMSQVAEAHRIMDASGHTGKIVLLAQ